MEHISIINIITIILYLILSWFTITTKNYVKKKGSNQADKEDLEELTAIVERVKLATSSELEDLRKKLDVEASREKEIFYEEKQAIIEFYTLMHYFILSELDINAYDYNYSNYHEIDSKISEINSSLRRVEIANAKVNLFLDDNDTISKAFNINLLAVNMKLGVEHQLFRLKLNLESSKKGKERLDRFSGHQGKRELFEKLLEKDEEERKKIIKNIQQGQSQLKTLALKRLGWIRLVVRERWLGKPSLSHAEKKELDAQEVSAN